MQRYEIHLVNLDPKQSSEIRKTRPCVIISPDEMNRHLRTVIVAPMTSALRPYRSRIGLVFEGKDGQIALDQIRTVDKTRLVRRLGQLSEPTAHQVAELLQRMFAFA
jgi:mRNA interferase MazF